MTVLLLTWVRLLILLLIISSLLIFCFILLCERRLSYARFWQKKSLFIAYIRLDKRKCILKMNFCFVGREMKIGGLALFSLHIIILLYPAYNTYVNVIFFLHWISSSFYFLFRLMPVAYRYHYYYYHFDSLLECWSFMHDTTLHLHSTCCIDTHVNKFWLCIRYQWAIPSYL